MGQANLGKVKAVSKRYTLTFYASKWTQASTGRYTQTVAVSGMTAETYCRYIEIDMSAATEDTISDLREAWSLIDKAEAVSGGVKLTAFDGAPSINFNAIVEVET